MHTSYTPAHIRPRYQRPTNSSRAGTQKRPAGGHDRLATPGWQAFPHTRQLLRFGICHPTMLYLRWASLSSPANSGIKSLSRWICLPHTGCEAVSSLAAVAAFMISLPSTCTLVVLFNQRRRFSASFGARSSFSYVCSTVIVTAGGPCSRSLRSESRPIT